MAYNCVMQACVYYNSLVIIYGKHTYIAMNFDNRLRITNFKELGAELQLKNGLIMQLKR